MTTYTDKELADMAIEERNMVLAEIDFEEALEAYERRLHGCAA